jgi:death on curing protein
MRYVSLQEIISLHSLLIAQSGGSSGLRDRGTLESAVAQPEASFGGQDLYPDLASKAAALGHALTQNHPFVDGNKRIGHAAMENISFAQRT